MLYTLNPALEKNVQVRVLGITGFAILTAIGAKISIPYEPVPVTMQVFFVLLAGLTLGPRDGAISLLIYQAAVLSGLPLDANGLGTKAFISPTAGYLLSFPIAAWLTGMLAINKNFAVRLLAGLVGVAVIYLFGTNFLRVYLGFSWQKAYEVGVEPFILIDLAKAIAAAALGEGARQWWLRQLNG